MKVLLTGAAGFIGFHTSLKLLKRGDDVVGLDNLNDYYDVSLKQARLDQIHKTAKSSDGAFAFHQIDISNSNILNFRITPHERNQRWGYLSTDASYLVKSLDEIHIFENNLGC